MAHAGGRHPAYCTALGKVLLADLPWEDVEPILAAHPPEQRTAATLVEPRGAPARARARRASRATPSTREERTPGVVCVAAPIRDLTRRGRRRHLDLGAAAAVPETAGSPRSPRR